MEILMYQKYSFLIEWILRQTFTFGVSLITSHYYIFRLTSAFQNDTYITSRRFEFEINTIYSNGSSKHIFMLIIKKENTR